MTRLIPTAVLAIVLSFCAGSAGAHPSHVVHSHLPALPGPSAVGDVYGPGIGIDLFGRPTVVVPLYPGSGPALDPITPDVYGPGIGMDATGRPVITVPK